MGRRRHDAGMLMRPPATTLLDQALPGEEVTRRADRRPRRCDDLGMPRHEPVEQLAGSPIGMGAARLAQQASDVWCDAVGTVVRRVAPLLQASPAVLMVAGQPLVPGLPADAVPRAELRPRVEAEPIVGDEPFALFHG
jgi:hypothetical protein